VGLVLLKLACCESRTLKDNLVLVVANALHYNPVLALQALQAQGAVGQFLGGWFSMIMAAKSSGKPKHFKRMQDKKVGSPRAGPGAEERPLDDIDLMPCRTAQMPLE